MIIDPIDPTQLREGMQVIGSDNQLVGLVKKVSETDVLIDRRFAPDIVLSFGFIRGIEEDRILLTIPADDAPKKDWRQAI